jgi:hypothetical protein
MRTLIGIVIGIMIILNWDSIKNTLDNAMAKQGNSVAAPAKETQAVAEKPAETEAAKAQDLSGAVEERLKAIAAGK